MPGIDYSGSSGLIIPMEWASSVTQYGITWNFAQPRPVGQYVNGDWWVIGPVSITSITPESVLIDGSTFSGTAYTGRRINGTMINPGNRSFAVGGLKANNMSASAQGWDSLVDLVPNGGVNAAYSEAFNVDPGKTGIPLNVTIGSVVKVISRSEFLDNARQHIMDMAVLTVVDHIPPSDALRPGIAWTSKQSVFRKKHFNLSVFQNLTPPASAPDPVVVADTMRRMFELSMPDSITTGSIQALNNQPGYGREIATIVSNASLSLHLNYTTEQKLDILLGLAQIACDAWARAFEGGIAPGYGGGNTWKKVPVVITALALGAKGTATSIVDYADKAKNFAFAEDRHLFRVSAMDVATPRYTADGRPRSEYLRYMIGSAEWSESPYNQPERGGSNWNTAYRDVSWGKMLGSSLAVQLTTGGQALWNNPDFFTYNDNAWDRSSEFQQPWNSPEPFHNDMFAAHNVQPVGAASVLSAEVKDTIVYATFNQALDELIAVPDLSDFVVKVNGIPATTTGVVQVWRQNVGVNLSLEVTGNDVVTFSYTPGVNKLKNVYGTDVAAFVDQALVNKTDKVGGPNGTYPVVQFATDSRYVIKGTPTLGTAANALGTCALLKFSFATLPTVVSEIFGYSSASPPFRIFLNTNGSLEIRFTTTSATSIARIYTPALSVNTVYDILFSVDSSQATNTAGFNCYVNGVAQTLSFSSWTGGTGVTVGWNRGATFTLNFSGISFKLGGFWLNTTERVDLTNATTRSKFTSTTTGNLDILTLGNGITGTRPSVFLVGNNTQWNSLDGLNRGTGSKFAYLSGTPVTLVSGAEWI